MSTSLYVTGSPAMIGSVTRDLVTVMSALRMTSTVASAMRAAGLGSGVGDSATTRLMSGPAAAPAGTSNVTTTLAVSPGRRSPTAHGKARAVERSRRRDRAERRPGGRQVGEDDVASGGGPWLEIVIVNSAAVPAATASPVATFVAWTSADWTTDVVAGGDTTGAGLASEVNEAVLASTAPVNDGSSVPAMRTVSVVPGSIGGRSQVTVPASVGAARVRCGAVERDAAREHVGERRRGGGGGPGVADGDRVGDLTAGGERAVSATLATADIGDALEGVDRRVASAPSGSPVAATVAVFVTYVAAMPGATEPTTVTARAIGSPGPRRPG